MVKFSLARGECLTLTLSLGWSVVIFVCSSVRACVRPRVRLSVHPIVTFASPEWTEISWWISPKLLTQYQVCMTLMTFSRSWAHRSKSCNDGHRNLANLVTLETLNAFEPKLTDILCHELITSWRSLIERSRSQATFSKNLLWRFAVEDRLV